MKKLALISLFGFLFSCSWLNEQISPRFPQSSDFLNRFPANKKSVVILRFNSKYPSSVWCKYQKNSMVKSDECIKIEPSKYYQILMVEPAIYEIEEYEKATKLYKKKDISHRFYKNGKRKDAPILSFEAKKNKISFLGDVNFKSDRNKNKDFDYEYEKIKQDFLNQDLKNLNKKFKNHKAEIEILNYKLDGKESVIDRFFIKNKAKTKSEFKK